MSLSQNSEISKIEVLANGVIQVQRADIVCRDGDEIARTYHRHVLVPGDSLNGVDARVAAVAAAVWTDEVIEQYIAAQASLRRQG